MSENQTRILQMISDGKISVDEGERLLKLVGEEKESPDFVDAVPVPPVPPFPFTPPPAPGINAAETGKTKGSRYTGFTRIIVSSAVDVRITRDEQYSVNITPEDFHEVIVEQEGETLHIRRPGFWGMWMGWGVRPRVRITMPDLAEFKIGGASYGTVRDFQLHHDLKLNVNGASHLKLNNMSVGGLQAILLGASSLTGDVKVNGEARLNANGAARLELTGTGQSARFDLSGATNVKMSDFKIHKAEVEASGAVNANIFVDANLDARLSGASNLYVKGSAVIGSISTSGASHLHRA